MEETSTSICSICNTNIEGEMFVVYKKRIKTLISASDIYKDNKHEKWSGKDSLIVHKKCNCSYASRHKLSSVVSQHNLEPNAGQDRGSQCLQELEWNNDNCVLCMKDDSQTFINEDQKKPPEKRDSIKYLTEKGKTTLIDAAKRKENDKSAVQILICLNKILKLRNIETKYHQSCYRQFTYKKNDQPAHRPIDNDSLNVVKFVTKYIKDNSDECQFSLHEILNEYPSSYPCSERNMIFLLQKEFTSEIVISAVHSVKTGPIISNRNAGQEILSKHFYENKQVDKNEENERLIEAVGKKIKDEARLQVYDNTVYNSSQNFLETIESDIPKYLNLLLNVLLCRDKKGDSEKWNRIKIAMSHVLLSAIRPRSFNSCLKLGLGITLHRKYGSMDLLNILSNLGFTASYADVVQFESSVLMNLEEPIFSAPTFSQFVFDNADHNISTLDGLNTFHAMGGIHCATPSSSVSSFLSIPKCKVTTTEKILQQSNVGYVPLKFYQPSNSTGLAGIKVEDLNMKNPINSAVEILPTDFLWLYAKSTDSKNTPGWSGFMEILTKNLCYSKSRIFYLPFINAPPSNYDIIFTALTTAVEKSKSLGQNFCVVTFDQPLYNKAREIIASSSDDSPLRCIILRLGSFHTLMSFLGSIGYIMDGSGLKEVLCTTYAELSVDKMLTGHAYARAVREHLLMHAALGRIILSFVELNEEEEKELQETLLNIKNADIFLIRLPRNHFRKLLINSRMH